MNKNYKSHCLNLKDIIKANSVNVKIIISQYKSLGSMIKRLESATDNITKEIIIDLYNIKEELRVNIEKSIEQAHNLYSTYDDFIDELLTENR